MERSRIWILALLALLSVVTLFAKPGHAQDAKVVIAHKKALSEMGEGNRLDPLDNVLRVNKLREAALLELEARARFSTAWEGARIPCPTCKPGRLLKQICLACAGAGEVACTRCVGDAALQLSQTRNAAEGREHLGVFYWWRWLTTYAKVERDKDGFAIGGGTLPCPRFGFPGHKDERCKECKGKDVIKCDDCKGKGAQKCVACKGKGCGRAHVRRLRRRGRAAGSRGIFECGARDLFMVRGQRSARVSRLLGRRCQGRAHRV